MDILYWFWGSFNFVFLEPVMKSLTTTFLFMYMIYSYKWNFLIKDCQELHSSGCTGQIHSQFFPTPCPSRIPHQTNSLVIVRYPHPPGNRGWYHWFIFEPSLSFILLSNQVPRPSKSVSTTPLTSGPSPLFSRLTPEYLDNSLSSRCPILVSISF